MTTSMQAAEISYNLGAGTSDYGTGQSRNETYDVALHINDPALVGSKVKGVRIYFSSVEGVSATKAWLSKDVVVKSMKLSTADIETVDFEAAEGINEVAFTPYTITAEGLYVGYTLTAAKDVAKTPIRTTPVYDAEGFYIHTSGLYRSSWRSIGDEAGSLSIEVLLEGDFTDNAATAINVPEVNAVTNSQNNITFAVMNQGQNKIESIDYTITINGATADYTANLSDNPVMGFYGNRVWLAADLPMVTEKGTFSIDVNVTRVNGVANTSTTPQGSGLAKFYNFLPVKRPVCDEYTGLWCGWCTRGYVAMETMAERYGSDFIGLCFHNSDPMQIMDSSNFPITVSGFPSADMDRDLAFDPSLSNVQIAWDWYRQQFTPLAVDVAADIDGDEVKVTAYVTSPIDIDNDRYELAFVLVQDGMHNTLWGQNNYYSGRDDLRDGVMDDFIDDNSVLYDLEYNGVVIAWSGRGSIEGSLPEKLEGEVAATYDYTFDLTQCLSTYTNTKGQSLIQDRTKLKGVAMVIDKTTGFVVNANQVYVGSSTVTSIDGPATSTADVVSHTRFYDLQGRPVVTPQPGSMLIKAETLRSGEVRTRKMVY